jgi:hypothetical protein
MERKEFSILIHASNEAVWDILWSNDSYTKWTAPFCEGSFAETGWRKGSKVRFLGPDGGGMVSIVSENIPNKFMSFEHKGIVVNGIEDYSSELAKELLGTLEYYTLQARDGKTELFVDMDIADSHKEYFLSIWPKALQKVKELAEEKKR